MTVCVAAVCRGPQGTGFNVIGAADRMLTAGQILEYEAADQTKVLWLTSAIAVLTAGDSGVQPQILYEVSKIVLTRVQSEPKNWWLVSDVADLYAEHATRYRDQETERAYLRPLGLTRESWVDRQQQLSPDLVLKIAQQLGNHPAPDVAAIVMGVDAIGSHIYVVQTDDSDARMSVSCADSVGFAAIGIGAWHAQSYMMLSGHSTRHTLAQGLRLVHAAKKRAEVAPGVGAKATDMIAIGPSLGTRVNVAARVIEKLDEMYERERRAIEEIDKQSRVEIQGYIDSLIPPEKGQGDTPAPPDDKPSAD